MGAPRRDKRDSPELFHSNDDKKKKHQEFIQNLVEKGYTIESDEHSEETGLDGELISETQTTVLEPPSDALPILKFEAKETFGRYNYEDQGFEAWDDPHFKIESYKRSADIRFRNDPWEKIDLTD